MRWLFNLNNRRFFWLITGLAILLSIGPWLIGWSMRPAGYEFFGNSAVNPWDPAVYYGYIEQGRTGGVFMHDILTSEPYAATLFQPLWWLLGRLAAWVHLATPTIFALARTALVPLLAGALWWGARWVFSEPRQQRWAFGLSLFLGGLGPLVALLAGRVEFTLSPDLWVTEALPVLTLISSPHFLIVTSGIIFTLIGIERAYASNQWRWVGWAGLAALVTLAIHPFHVITWVLIWALLTTWRAFQRDQHPWRYLLMWVSVLAIASPALALYGLQAMFDPLVIDRAIQNVNLTWPPLQTFTLLGLALPLIVFGWTQRPRNARWQSVLIMAAAYVIAIALPIYFQRRLSHGMMIFFAWLAVPGAIRLADILKRQATPLRWVGATIAIFLGLWSWLWVSGVNISAYAYDKTIAPVRQSYLSPEYQALLSTIKQFDHRSQPLLASLTDSKVISGLTAQTVYVAQAVETVDYSRKAQQLADFFTTASKSTQLAFVQRHHICLILYGPREQTYGSTFQPATWTTLTPIWQTDQRTLYRTDQCQ